MSKQGLELVCVVPEHCLKWISLGMMRLWTDRKKQGNRGPGWHGQSRGKGRGHGEEGRWVHRKWGSAGEGAAFCGWAGRASWL